MKGGGYGLLGDNRFGIVWAFLGGLLSGVLMLGSSVGFVGRIVVASIGAVLLIAIGAARLLARLASGSDAEYPVTQSGLAAIAMRDRIDELSGTPKRKILNLTGNKGLCKIEQSLRGWMGRERARGSLAARGACDILDEHAEWAIFLILLLEESGIPLPLPGDVMVVLAAYACSRARSPGGRVLLLESATLIGSSVLYWLARRGGGPCCTATASGCTWGRPPGRGRALRASLRLAGDRGRAAGSGLRILIGLVAGHLAVPYPRSRPGARAGASVYSWSVWTGLRRARGLPVRPGARSPDPLRGRCCSARASGSPPTSASGGARACPAPRRAAGAVPAGDGPQWRAAGDGRHGDRARTAARRPAALQRTTRGRPSSSCARAGPARRAASPRRMSWSVASSCTSAAGTLGDPVRPVERWLPDPDWVGGLAFALLPCAVSCGWCCPS